MSTCDCLRAARSHGQDYRGAPTHTLLTPWLQGTQVPPALREKPGIWGQMQPWGNRAGFSPVLLGGCLPSLPWPLLKQQAKIVVEQLHS